MMESTNSCTNLSGSKLNFFTAHGTIACRKGAPGMSSCFASQASRRPAIPDSLGIPPTPGGRSSTRLLSVTANCPRRKNASRGSVASQFGLPRPAFISDREFSSAVFDATLWTKSLISNGPSLSNSFSFAVSDNRRLRRGGCPLAFAGREGLRVFVIVFFAVESCSENVFSRQQHDNDHAPDCQQGVPYGVGNGVAERWNLALGLVADQTKRCRRRARPGDDAEVERVVEAEHVLGREHAENQGDRSGDRAPQEETDALRFQTVDEARTGGDANDGDEDVEADRVHEPDGGRRNASKGRAHRAQPAADDPEDQRSAGCRQGERHASYLEDQRSEERRVGKEGR